MIKTGIKKIKGKKAVYFKKDNQSFILYPLTKNKKKLNILLKNLNIFFKIKPKYNSNLPIGLQLESFENNKGMIAVDIIKGQK